MKNLSLKNKILLGIASALALVILAFLIWTIVAVAVGMAPPKDIVTAGEYDFTFDGKITLNEVEYDVSLNGKDDKFSVSANKLSSVVNGTYEFTEGQGYTFTFNDANGTIVRTQYDTVSKSFGFIYHLDLGARGAGNLKLTLKDENFQVVGEPWQDILSFSGTATVFGSLRFVCGCSCAPDGTFNIFLSDGPAAIQPISGTYEFVDGKYIFTAEDGSVYTAEKNADGLYEFEVGIVIPALPGGAPQPCVFTQVVLTVD